MAHKDLNVIIKKTRHKGKDVWKFIVDEQVDSGTTNRYTRLSSCKRGALRLLDAYQEKPGWTWLCKRNGKVRAIRFTVK